MFERAVDALARMGCIDYGRASWREVGRAFLGPVDLTLESPSFTNCVLERGLGRATVALSSWEKTFQVSGRNNLSLRPAWTT